MRFIHTADWHLGRLFHGTHLTEDQAHVLEQLCEVAREIKPDALIVSGDVYDRAVPPPDAVALLDHVLSRVVLDLGIVVIMIAGNHDSPERLGFGSRVLSARGLHVIGLVGDEVPCVTLQDESGPVHFYPIPYTEPAVAREKLDRDDLHDHQAVVQALMERIRGARAPGERSVLISHAFVTGGSVSESERPLSVGGVDHVDPGGFQDFDYVALGHLHRPQRAGGDQIRYSGSLLKYSFSEADHQKAINLVEMDAQGTCSVESIHLTPRRDVRRKEGFFKEILMGPDPGENSDDYLMVSLLDKAPILDVMGRLREVYPNALHVERPYLDLGRDTGARPADHRALNDKELFAAFFSQVTGDDLTEAQESAYEDVVDKLRRNDREIDQ